MYAELADHVKGVIDATFKEQGWVATHDRVHESLGHERTSVGISPVSSTPLPGNALVMGTTLLIQVYTKYTLDVEPKQKVDPRKITKHAERLARALNEAQAATSDALWYYSVDGIDYPNDPTGNKTRFEMTVTAHAHNQGIYAETTG